MSIPRPSLSTSYGRPPSPTLSHRSQSTVSVAADFAGAPSRIISKKGLRASLAAYDELITAGRAYRLSLAQISKARESFALAIERCARLKGVSDESSGFLAASGLHYLIANQEQVLGDTMLKMFEEPLAQGLEAYRVKVTDRQITYDRSLTELSLQIRATEAANIRHGLKRQRDLTSFRTALSTLQAQVDALDRLKAEYYTSVLSFEEETWDTVLSRVGHVVRSTLDIYERVSAKGSDLALEPILARDPDPFNAYGEPQENKLFSILTPLGMISPSLTTVGGFGRSEGGRHGVPGGERQAEMEPEAEGTPARAPQPAWGHHSPADLDRPHWGEPDSPRGFYPRLSGYSASSAIAEADPHAVSGNGVPGEAEGQGERESPRRKEKRSRLGRIDEQFERGRKGPELAEAGESTSTPTPMPASTSARATGVPGSRTPVSGAELDARDQLVGKGIREGAESAEPEGSTTTEAIATEDLDSPQAASPSAQESTTVPEPLPSTRDAARPATNPYFPDLDSLRDVGELEAVPVDGNPKPGRGAQAPGVGEGEGDKAVDAGDKAEELGEERLMEEPAPWEGNDARADGQ
ncbi:hypothetical protein DACRYDRAFT_119306 [Dacryopinax primogenitus]|uniref:IMD domain-containing protein n=1 Tax=Dacryopinax primogenitus (strain DJM 731) TaxID=1858805 RepID=M5FRL7_DACPD|nr:uncharacterized protein DACRYDRAFT_119306 [Dacryopinax primogenitus]EJT97644.1 hypothetical protein DACRYDRAFT_119306 [Dacryopinax primogenitus]